MIFQEKAMTILQEYVDWVQRTQFEQIPDKLLTLAKYSIIDTIAVSYYARSTPGNDVLYNYAASRQSSSVAACISFPGKMSATDAALVNGYLAHLDDYDEVSLPGHTGVIMVPAVMAMAEMTSASGKEALRAYVLGAELGFKIAEILTGSMYATGWHSSPVICTLSAAASASILLHLPKDQFVSAIGIAASRACGLMVNFGTLCKPYHMGMAAANGIEAAQLAQSGITASADALEGRGGYFSCFLGKKMPEIRFDWDRWSMLGNGMLFKKYACCVGSHSSIETVRRMMTKYGFDYRNVSDIQCDVSGTSFASLKYPLPDNAFQAKFSAAFPIAWLLHNMGRLNNEDFIDKNVRNPAVRNTMEKIHLNHGLQYREKNLYPNGPCTITVTLQGGDVVTEQGELSWCGEKCWENLIDEESLKNKFAECAKNYIEKPDAEELADRLLQLEYESDAGTVFLKL